MVDIISSILEAEKKSDEIIALANSDSKKIIIDGDMKAESIRNKAIDGFKAHRFLELKNAETKAEENYSAIVEEGKAQAMQIENDSKVKIENISLEIVNEILGK